MNKNIHQFLNRKSSLFENDLTNHEIELSQTISKSKFLVLGGAGTIGQALKTTPEAACCGY